MKSLLLNDVKLAFSDILSKYSLCLKEVNQYHVVLVGDSYGLGILLDRDGLVLMYYDLSCGVKKAYNLGLFLIHKRRGQLTFVNDDKSDKPLDEYLPHNLAILSKHLITAGQDVLSGDKDWIQRYSWPSTNVCEDVLAVI